MPILGRRRVVENEIIAIVRQRATLSEASYFALELQSTRGCCTLPGYYLMYLKHQ